MDELWFVGMAFDKDRLPATQSDVERLVEVLQGQGFSVEDPLPVSEYREMPAIHFWRGSFYGRIVLDPDWMVQVITDEKALQESRDADVNYRGIDRLVEVIGIVTEFADTYFGCISLDPEDDMTILVEDPPVEITEPLALVYLGSRYVADWEIPGFAAAAELDVALRSGRVIVPVLDELA